MNGERLPKTVISGLGVILSGYIFLSSIYQWLIPLGYGPDEPRHYGYIQHVVLYRSLPVLGDPSHPYYCHMDPRPPNAIGIHPPLYYAMLAPFYALLAGRRIDHPQAEQTPFPKLPPSQSRIVQHTLRTFSLLMGLTTLWLITRIALLFSSDRWWLWGMVGFVAWLPHFLLLSAVMNNDTVTILLGHLFLFLLVKHAFVAGNPVKDASILGIVFGLLGLSKASTLSWFPLLLLGAGQIAMHAQPRNRWRVVALAMSLPVLICGWWYARFYMFYGRVMPIVKWTENPGLLLHSPGDLFLRSDTLFLVWRFLTGIARSLWGQVDWFILKPEHVVAWQQKFGTPAQTAYPLTEPLWFSATFISLISFVGWLIRLGRWFREREWMPQCQAGAFLALGFAFLFLALMHYTLFIHPGGYEGGRYLLPSIGAFAFLFWKGLFNLVPQGKRHWVVCGMLALLLTLNVGCIVNLRNFLNPLYAPPQ